MNLDTLKVQLTWTLENGDRLDQQWVTLRRGPKGELRAVTLDSAEASKEFQRLVEVHGMAEEATTVDSFEMGSRGFAVHMKGFRNPRVTV